MCVRLLGTLFHDHPPKLAEEGVAVHRASFSKSALHFGRKNLATSSGVPTVEDYVNVSMVGKALF